MRKQIWLNSFSFNSKQENIRKFDFNNRKQLLKFNLFVTSCKCPPMTYCKEQGKTLTSRNIPKTTRCVKERKNLL